MAVDAKLEVEVGVKLDQLQRGLLEAGKDVSNFVVNADGQIVSFGKSIATLERQLRTFQAGIRTTLDPSRLNTLNNAIKITEQRLESTRVLSRLGADGLGKYSKAQFNAGYAAQNFGRVLQDIPFGLIAIQNNIVPLVESLGGSAGLSLAFSLVTAAATIWFQATQSSERAAKNAKKTNDDYADSLDTVTAAQLKGAQSAAKDITELKLLYDTYTNTNQSLTARKQAYEQLQQLYPAYFGNIKFEQEASKKTEAAYIKLSAAILATARARAAADIITKNTTLQLENEQRIADLQVEILKTAKDLTAQKQLENDIRAAGGSEGSQAVIVEKRYVSLVAEANKLLQANNKLGADNVRLAKEAQVQVGKGGVISGDIGDAPKKAKEETQKLIIATQQWYDLQRKNASLSLSEAAGKSFDTGSISTSVISKSQKDSLARLGEAMKQTADIEKEQLFDFQNAILNNLTNGFADFFNTILTKGTLAFKQLGNAILGEFARVLTSSVAKKLLGLLAGVLTGGAGGGILAGAFKFLGFANGTNNAPGGLAMVGERGPELVNLPRGSSVTPMTRLGGGSVQVFIANSYIRGTAIETVYNRSVNKSYRTR